MNIDVNQKILKYQNDIKKQKGLFYNSKDTKERRGCLNNIESSIKYLEVFVNSPQFPDFMRNGMKSTIENFRVDLDGMSKVVDKIPVVQKTGGGNKGGKNDDGGDDELAKGIANTIVSEKTNVKWDDVAGLKEAKNSLNEALIYPINFPDFFTGNVKPWRGILLYGPPGTGKTFLAKAAANECNSTFFSVSSSDLISKFMGESEKLIKNLFKVALDKAPSIIFIDEIDSICGSRSEGENESTRRVKNEFLIRMNELEKKSNKLLVLGATNIPWGIDNAVLRRFERRIYIELPDEEARIICTKNKLKGLDHVITEDQFKEIASKLINFSGADIEILVKDAVMEPVRRAQNAKRFKVVMQNGKRMHLPVPSNWNQGEYVDKTLYELPDNSLIVDNVSYQDFNESLKRCKPSVGDTDLKEFIKWTKEFGISG